MTLTTSRREMVHLSGMDVFQQEFGVGRNAAVTAAINWTDLIRGLEATRERDYAVREDVEGSWLDTQAFPCVPFSSHPPLSNPAALSPAAVAPTEKNQVGCGGGDFSLQVDSPAYSSTSSERNSSGLVDSASEVDNTSLSSYLMDGNIRAMLKKITVNEGVLNKAVESLGGGEKGLKALMSYIVTWMKDQSGNNNNNNNSPEFSISQTLSQEHNQQHQPLKSLLGFPHTSPPFGAPSSGGMAPIKGAPTLEQERFHPLSSQMVQTSPEAPHLQGGQDLRHLHRIKSRRLMVVDGEVESVGEQENSFCPTGFRDIGAMSNHSPYPKLEMGPVSPGATLGPLMPQMQKYDDELQQQQQHARFNCLQQQPSMVYTVGMNEGKNSTAPSHAATTRAARKNRIARQRQSVLNQNRASAGGGQALGTVVAGPGGAIAGCGSGHWSLGAPRKTGIYTTGAQQGLSGDHPATINTRKVVNMDLLTALLQKELRPSDVGNLGRIILPKKEAEMHLPFLAVREGISLQMEDFDTGVCWSVRYRFWPNNKSRMYLLENTGEFVKLHHLEEGDLLILYRSQKGNFVVRGKKKLRSEGGIAHSKVAHSLAKVFPEENITPKDENFLTERLYGGALPEACGKVKEEPPWTGPDDDDPFFKEVMHRMGSSSGGLPNVAWEPLERFPSLNLDFVLDDMVVPRTDSDVADLSKGEDLVSGVVPKVETAS